MPPAQWRGSYLCTAQLVQSKEREAVRPPTRRLMRYVV